MRLILLHRKELSNGPSTEPNVRQNYSCKICEILIGTCSRFHIKPIIYPKVTSLVSQRKYKFIDKFLLSCLLTARLIELRSFFIELGTQHQI